MTEVAHSPILKWCLERAERAINAQTEKVPVCILQGGTSSGKTYSTLQCLFAIAAKYGKINNEPTIITVVGQDVPNLKRGAITDAENIAVSFETVIKSYNKTDKMYKFTNGAKIEFVSYEGMQDAKAGKRHILFVNEANGIRFEVFEQLLMRTKVAAFVDYNPDAEFWVHTKYKAEAMRLGNFCRSTYKDNPFLTAGQIANIEAKRDDPERWRVYGEGRTGKTEGLIYKRAEPWDVFPEDVTRFGYGLDFGYSEPLALVKCGLAAETIYAQEIAYVSGLTPRKIVELFEQHAVPKVAPVWADGARPEIIAEMRRAGYNIRPATKGPESVLNGIMLLNEYPMRLIGANLNKEARAYKWQTHAADGRMLQKPAQSDDHALDALRYWGVMNLGRKQSGRIVSL